MRFLSSLFNMVSYFVKSSFFLSFWWVLLAFVILIGCVYLIKRFTDFQF